MAQDPQLSREELLAFLKKRRGLLDGVCVTGGEPLLRPDLRELLEAVKALGYPVKLDTNGSHPRALAELVEAGLADYVAMDIKNSPALYPLTAGVPGLDLGPIRESAAFLLEGRVEYEFRTTVVREFHDRDTVIRPGLHPWGREKLEEFAGVVRPWVPGVALRGVE